jgi:hypothetical protein
LIRYFATTECGFAGDFTRRIQLGQRAAIYCQVSTADQTCERQEVDLLAFALKAGFNVVGVWKETASGAKDDRAQRKKVMALAQAREVGVVLVTELTRWGRSTIDLFHQSSAFGGSPVLQGGLAEARIGRNGPTGGATSLGFGRGGAAPSESL